MPYEDEEPPFADRREPPPDLDQLAKTVIGAAIEVHRTLGPGFPEDTYELALVVELGLRGIRVERQKRFEIKYKGVQVGYGKVDLLVEGRLIVENKSVETLIAVHRLQVMSYMHAMHQPLALLINYNVPVLKEGIRRIILNEYI